MPWGGVRKLRGRLARYGAAVAAVGVVLLLKILLDPLTGNESPFLLFFAAVMVAALLGGLGAGLLATVLAVLINWFVFLEPAYSLRILEPEQGLRLLLFALEGTLISALVAAMHVARERAEADRGSLALSEERYRAVVEQSTEGIFLLDAESLLILESNPAMQRMFGYTPEELHGMELYELVAHSRGDVDEAVGQTLRERRRLVGERRYKRKDGTLLDVEVGASTITYNGHHAICAVVRDITSRKRAEEALAAQRRAVPCPGPLRVRHHRDRRRVGRGPLREPGGRARARLHARRKGRHQRLRLPPPRRPRGRCRALQRDHRRTRGSRLGRVPGATRAWGLAPLRSRRRQHARRPRYGGHSDQLPRRDRPQDHRADPRRDPGGRAAPGSPASCTTASSRTSRTPPRPWRSPGSSTKRVGL